MTTTDRMSNLDSRREITDRTGQTVILGNSVGSAALSSIAQIVSAAAGESRATSSIYATAAASLDFQNASFGIWSVFWDTDAAASLICSGESIGASRFNDITTAALTWGADAMLLNIRAFISTQVYTPTPGTAKVVVYCLGGGGGGGGCAASAAGLNSAGAGGGAGAMAMGIITSGFSGVTITVGAAGAASAVGAFNGGDGGSSSFGSVLIGGGGFGGTGDTSGGIARATGGGAGGSASGSASLFGARGEAGHQGYAFNTNCSMGGKGGDTQYGSGGYIYLTGGLSNGPAATGFGAGGGGGANVGGQAARSGGAGSQGLVIVYEYNA